MLRADPEDQCYMLLTNKYLLRKSFWQCQGTSGSQFWKGILNTRDILKWGCRSEVNNGLNTRFWEDVWAGDISLSLEFATLYNLCGSKGVLVGDCWEGDGWKVCFRKPIGDSDFKEWEGLMDIIEGFRLNGERGHFVWLLDKSKTYSTRSMHV